MVGERRCQMSVLEFVASEVRIEIVEFDTY
jgi:hypothetical protein